MAIYGEQGGIGPGEQKLEKPSSWVRGMFQWPEIKDEDERLYPVTMDIDDASGDIKDIKDIFPRPEEPGQVKVLMLKEEIQARMEAARQHTADPENYILRNLVEKENPAENPWEVQFMTPAAAEEVEATKEAKRESGSKD